MNFQYKNQNEKTGTLNEEFVDKDENEDIGFVEDNADDMKDVWIPDVLDPYDDEYEDDNEEYEDDNCDDEDEWGLGVEDNDGYFVDNLGEPSIDGQGSQDDISQARNHYEAMVRHSMIDNLIIIYILCIIFNTSHSNRIL